MRYLCCLAVSMMVAGCACCRNEVTEGPNVDIRATNESALAKSVRSLVHRDNERYPMTKETVHNEIAEALGALGKIESRDALGALIGLYVDESLAWDTELGIGILEAIGAQCRDKENLIVVRSYLAAPASSREGDRRQERLRSALVSLEILEPSIGTSVVTPSSSSPPPPSK